MRWWGWGEDGHDVVLPEHALAMLRSELGIEPGAGAKPVALEQVRLPDSRLDASVRARLAAAVGEDHVLDDRAARVEHAAGRSYPDLVRLRTGELEEAPDAVVEPGSADEVQALLAACAEARVAVVPFGGGSSVVGGVDPYSDGFPALISLDLRRLDRVVDVDRMSLTATLDGGLFGPELERRLAAQGVTLGHFPQSFEYSTVGGWVATRSAGQASTGHGRIDELVEGLRMIAPAGEVARRPVPATAAGPDLRELLVGSEGVLGVICEATLRVRALPDERHYEGWSFRSFAEGCEALRVMEQADASPDVIRLSDEHETRLSLALASSGSATERAGRAYLRMRGHEGGCIAIAGFEGEEDDVERRRLHSGALLRAGGGLRLGRRPGEAWLRGRYAGPYLRDALLDYGAFVETLETATSWSNLPTLYAAVGDALRRSLSARGTPPLVMCHVSHLYRSGASLYYTFLARQQPEAAIEQWRAAKAAASDAIVANGGTITHHHAIGRDHAPWLSAEIGTVGVDLIRDVKERLDPVGIMNPGKLLPS
jgi:alkyldihydroxyacetonephosphate synthase